MTWSEAFSKHLDALGLSQIDALVALRKARIKVSVSQICYWRRGTYPRAGTRQKLERWSKGAIDSELPAASSHG